MKTSNKYNYAQNHIHNMIFKKFKRTFDASIRAQLIAKVDNQIWDVYSLQLWNQVRNQTGNKIRRRLI